MTACQLQRRVLQRHRALPGHGHPGVRVRDVEHAECVDGERHRRLDLGPGGDVGLQAGRLAALAGDRLDHRADPALDLVGDDDLRAFFGREQGDLTP